MRDGRIRRVLLAAVALAAALAIHPGVADGARQGDPPSTRDERRAVLDRVLARPEFQRTATAIIIERIGERVSGWVLQTWDRLGLARLGTARAARGLAWILGLLALAALTWWLVQSLQRSGSRQAFRIGAVPVRRSARAWAREALAASRAGDRREAARCAYHATVVRLQEEGAWREDETRTPREYLRLLPAEHRRRALVADLTGRFERAWYGSANGSPDDTRAMLAHLEELGCLASDRGM